MRHQTSLYIRLDVIAFLFIHITILDRGFNPPRLIMKSLRFFIGCAIATIPVLAFSQLGAPITIASSEIPYLPPDESTDLSLVDNVDLDGDGQKDILTCGYIGERLGPIWYKNLGSGTYSAPHPIGQGIFSHTRNILAMDVNDDGQPDIVTTVQGSDSAGNWMNYGLGYFLNMGGGLFSSSPVLIDSVTTNSVSSN